MIYIFNPENDLAIADGGENYMPPKHAVTIAKDLSLLPMWYGEPQSRVWADAADQTDWLSAITTQFNITVSPLCLPIDTANTYMPWGWSAAMRKRLMTAGALESDLPTTDQIRRIKELSHRRIAQSIVQKMIDVEIISDTTLLAQEFHTLAEVAQFISSRSGLLLKSPWSGSGKGLYSGRGVWETPVERWVRGVLRKQGAVMGEVLHAKVQDFAMEFCSCAGVVTFVGYSYFQTNDKGVYTGNFLASDIEIENLLAEYIPTSQLKIVSTFLEQELTTLVAPYYSGYLGVDMLLYNTPDGVSLYPCVELNLRMNMGMLARLYYNRYVAAGKQGFFSIDYYPDSADLIASHKQLSIQKPLCVTAHTIESGYLSLCPITAHTHYRARIEVSR